MKDKTEVIKASGAIQMEGTISLLERRVWTLLLANAYEALPNKKQHRIAARELLDALGIQSRNYEHLRRILKNLMTTVVEWNLMGKDTTGRWRAMTLVAEAGLENGICEYEYSSTMSQLLYNPKVYARISLSLQNKFDSKHALALWEVCVDYLGASRNYGETPLIDVDTFRKLMGVASHKSMQEFKILKRAVIKPAIEEINEKTEFHVTDQYQRKGRSVTHIKFRIRRESPLPASNTQQGVLFPDLEELPDLARELVRSGLSIEDAFDIWQQQFNYVTSEKRPRGIDFDTYIYEKIDLLKRSRVNNPTGFLLSAIRENWSNPAFAKASRKKVEAAQQALVFESARAAEIEQHAYDAWRDQQFWRRFHSMPKAWQKASQDAFLNKMRTDPQHKLVWQLYNKDRNLQSPFIAGIFMGEIEGKLFPDPSQFSLETFRAEQQNQVSCAPAS